MLPFSFSNFTLAKAQLQLPQMLAQLDKYDLLIIDDLGYVKRSEAETSVLFELISHRYEIKSLLITSNQTADPAGGCLRLECGSAFRTFSEWDSIFADATMTVAAIDRLIYHAKIIHIQTQSFRQKTALARSTSSDDSNPSK